MITEAQDRYVSLSPAAGTEVLSFNFDLVNASWLAVYRTRAAGRVKLLPGTEYFVSLQGLNRSVVLEVPSLAGDIYEIISDTDAVRVADYLNGFSLSEAQLDAEADHVIRLMQEIKSSVRRLSQNTSGAPLTNMGAVLGLVEALDQKANAASMAAALATKANQAEMIAGLAAAAAALATKANQAEMIAGLAAAAAAPPTTDQVTAALAGAAFGAVGTYVLAQNGTAAAIAFGAMVAGSNLRPVAVGSLTSGETLLTGTWRCMGWAAATSTTTAMDSTLFMRIA
jgi:hypothetical protein